MSVFFQLSVILPESATRGKSFLLMLPYMLPSNPNLFSNIIQHSQLQNAITICEVIMELVLKNI